MTAEQLKNSILQMAVQGKLVPQDPNDEPASELIKRIREEKEKLIKEGKIKKEKNPSYIFRGEDNIPYEKVGKNEPVSIADEVPFEIPESWEWCRLGELFSTIMGQSPKGNTVSIANDGIEFHQGKICFGDMYLEPSEQTTSAPTKIAPSNSVLLCVRAPVGKVNITKREICIGRGLCAVIPHANMTAEYTYYLLETYEEILKKQATGTTFVAVTGEVVKNQLIPVPPIQEQQRIVAKIRELLPFIVEYNKKETKISELNTSFPDRLKKSILLEAVMGKLVPQDENDEPASALLERIREEKKHLIAEGKLKKDKHESIIYRRDNSHYEKIDGKELCIDDEIPFDIPSSWVWARTSSLGSMFRGKGIKRTETVAIGLPCVRYGEIYTSYDTSFVNTISYIDESLDKSCVHFSSGDVIFTLTGENKIDIAKAVAYLGESPVAAGGDMAYWTAHGINPLYIVFFMASPYCIEQKRRNATGDIIVHISTGKVGNFLIPIPPLKEQERIVEAVNEAFLKIEAL